jgi:lipopolysaccharide transport system permease protein
MASIAEYSNLLNIMVRRDITGRYRGAVLGLVWSFINPLLMLTVFTFVFSVVFQVRWDQEISSRYEFAILLFTGMIVHGFVAECLNRAPGVILENPSYVTKVRFPLQIIPTMMVCSAFFHLMINTMVLLAAILITRGAIPASAALFPLVVLPAFVGLIGVCLLLASFGVFLRDVKQITGTLSMVLLFLSPVFYPASALPERFRFILQMNPLTHVIEGARSVLVWGEMFDWVVWIQQMGGAVLVLGLGLYWFSKSRIGFADVV